MKENLSNSTRKIVGTALVGANTKKDPIKAQKGINDVAARMCAVKAWTPSECDKHQRESRSE